MTFEDLRTFIAVCDAGSVSAAAQALNKSQPAVSQHIGRLEQELGIALLERRSRGVVTTAAGSCLYESAAQSLSELSRAREKIDALRSGRAGSLSVVTGGTTLKHFMKDAIVRFRAEHPKLSVCFHQGHSTAHCIDALRKQRIDLGFVTMQADLQGIEQKPALRMRHALLLQSQHPLARRRRIAVSDLRGLELIGLASQSSAYSSLAQRLATSGIIVNTTATVDDWDLAYVLVTLGLGSAIVPAFHAHEFVRQGAVIALPIDGLEPIEVGWAARRFASLSRPAISFMQIMDEQLRATTRQGVRVVGDKPASSREAT
jgi:DNA-binding transcriptional LysR family regulator